MSAYYMEHLLNTFRYRLTVHDVPPKSRVETQVRLRIELDDVSTPAGLNGPRRPAELWKFIRIPKTASVKTRNVKGQCGKFRFCLNPFLD
jgi:hypothetical protein